MTRAPARELERPAAANAAAVADEPVEVQSVELPEAADSGARVPGGQLDIILDTAVEVSANLGDARMPARELLELGPGAVITLDRQAGQPIDLILNGVRFATGNLVVVGDQLGVRIKEILAPAIGGPVS
jgi:flagellar motor switch protein FliN/FliY